MTRWHQWQAGNLYAQQKGLVLQLSQVQGLRLPGMPVNRVMSVLKQIWAGLVKAVRVFQVIWPSACKQQTRRAVVRNGCGREAARNSRAARAHQDNRRRMIEEWCRRVSKDSATSSAWDPIYRIVRRIPQQSGDVWTDCRTCWRKPLAHAVGWALHVCPSDVPWHRVVNAAGRCSTERISPVSFGIQRGLLIREECTFARMTRLTSTATVSGFDRRI